MTKGWHIALFVCACLVHAAHGQDAISIEDLKTRSDGGDKAATRALAEAYYLGRRGVEQDFQAAAHWYRRLASQGDARAQTRLVPVKEAENYPNEKDHITTAEDRP